MDKNSANDIEIIKESHVLWAKLSELAKFDDTAYDEELKKSIADSLKLDSRDIASGLKERNISTTELLVAVFEALEPFSLMIVELLNLYSAAGASSNNNNIKIEFDFEDRKLSISLDEFKKYSEELLDHIVTRLKLNSPLKLIDRMKEIENGEISELHAPLEFEYFTQITNWLNQYYNDILPDRLPAFPKTQCSQIDSKLDQIVRSVENAIKCYRKGYSPSDGLKASIDKGVEKYKTDFGQAEKNRWIEDFVWGYYSFVMYFNQKLKSDNDIDSFVKCVDDILSDPQIFTTYEEIEQYNAVCEILDMPFWEHRYELYSVWVFTCITEAIKDLGIKYNVTNGVLQFKFSGVKLATIILPDIELEICAEIRHKAKIENRDGRKNGVQPDYTVFKRIKEEKE